MDLNRWDNWAFALLNQRLACSPLDLVMPWFTRLGLGYVQVGAILAYGLVQWRKPSARSLAGLLLAAFVVSGLLSLGVKQLIERDRPVRSVHARIVDEPLRQGSFPSGHTMTCFALAAVAATRRPRLAAAAWATAALVGISRIYIGVHWPSDVLAGALLGAAVGWLVCWAADGFARAKVPQTVAATLSVPVPPPDARTPETPCPGECS